MTGGSGGDSVFSPIFGRFTVTVHQRRVQFFMADYSVDEIVQKALTLGLLSPDQLQDVWTSFGTRNIELQPFVQALLRQGHLTKYQVDRLVSGEATGFYYGEYRVLYPVGAGTFARVFRAVHAENEKVAAIKVLRNRFASDSAAVDLFVREAELGMQLRHPNIVGVYEVNSYQNAHYMVMDFVEGQTLRQYVNAHKKVEFKIATRIATDICQGLDYAFKRGHLHRDMKLSNVLVSSAGKAVLVDFGLASETDESNDQKSQRAIDYAALERSTGVRRDDKRSDLFFLGTMFYQMLTGVAPLGEVRDRARRLNKSRFLSIKPISEIDPSIPYVLTFIADKSMRLDPEKRYQSPAAMLADLEVAVKKLEEGGGTAEEMAGKRQTRLASPSSLSLVHVAKKNLDMATVCVVESDPEMQNVFRGSLKRSGYRVLLFSTAERALERFQEPETNIDCVLINAQFLGKKGVIAFNELGRSPLTEEIPAVLLLDENQVKWAAKALRAKHRVAVGMPITMKRLQEVIRKLVHDKKEALAEAQRVKAAPVGAGDAKENKGAVSTKAMAPRQASPSEPAAGSENEKTAESGAAAENGKASGAASIAGHPSDSENAPNDAASESAEPSLIPEPSRPNDSVSSERDVETGESLRNDDENVPPPVEFETDLFDAALDNSVDSIVAKLSDNLDLPKDEPTSSGDNAGVNQNAQPDEDEEDVADDDYFEDDDL